MHDTVTLLVPEKSDIELDKVAAAWVVRGNPVQRLGKYWVKDETLASKATAVYGNQAFALVLAQIYNMALVSPDDALVAELDQVWTKRSIQLKTLAEATFPAFIKPVVPKIFQAGIFENAGQFAAATEGLPANEAILQSTIIDDINAEARCYVMDGKLYDMALYEGSIDTGQTFITAFIENNALPSPVVVDIAHSPSLGWFVLEFNACWGAGLNGCRAEKVIDCIVAASVQQ